MLSPFTSQLQVSEQTQLNSIISSVMSLSDHRTLSFIQSALAAAGTESVAVAYGELQEVAGVSYSRIAGSLRTLIALGVIAVEQAGRGRGREHVFRLSDAWRSVSTPEQAKQIAVAARADLGAVSRISGPPVPSAADVGAVLGAAAAPVVELDDGAVERSVVQIAPAVSAFAIRVGGYQLTFEPIA
jgi:hypothetical protein